MEQINTLIRVDKILWTKREERKLIEMFTKGEKIKKISREKEWVKHIKIGIPEFVSKSPTVRRSWVADIFLSNLIPFKKVMFSCALLIDSTTSNSCIQSQKYERKRIRERKKHQYFCVNIIDCTSPKSFFTSFFFFLSPNDQNKTWKLFRQVGLKH